MKIKELIQKLSTYDPEWEVAIPGYQESFIACDLSFEPIKVVLNIQQPTSHLAPHERIYNESMQKLFETKYPDKRIVNAILMDGTWEGKH